MAGGEPAGWLDERYLLGVVEVGGERGQSCPEYFVCYSREQRDLVRRIEAKLAARTRRNELRVWRDVRNLDVWEKFSPEIQAVLGRVAGAVPVKGFETRAGLFALDVGFA